jgi:hypothetical protein
VGSQVSCPAPASCALVCGITARAHWADIHCGGKTFVQYKPSVQLFYPHPLPARAHRRGGSCSTLRFGGSVHHHPLLASVNLRYALTAVPGLARQTAIPASAVHSMQVCGGPRLWEACLAWWLFCCPSPSLPTVYPSCLACLLLQLPPHFVALPCCTPPLALPAAGPL